MSRPLRRTRGDLISTALIAAVSVVAVGGVWLTAPIRESELRPPSPSSSPPPPWRPSPLHSRRRGPLTPGSCRVHRPLVIDGLVVAHDAHTVRALDPADGTEVWSYTRDLPLCSLGAAWGRVVTTWRAANGCGDVVSIDAGTGQYHRTRSAVSPDEVVAVNSNDRVGTVGAERLELWRSDLVRTVEYGTVEGIRNRTCSPTPGAASPAHSPVPNCWRSRRSAGTARGCASRRPPRSSPASRRSAPPWSSTPPPRIWWPSGNPGRPSSTTPRSSPTPTRAPNSTAWA